MKKIIQEISKKLKQITRMLGELCNTRSIKTKLIGAFVIPIIFIIILGIVSYKKASDGMIENFENSSKVSIEMIGEYYELGLRNISSKAVNLAQDEVVRGYYSQLFAKNPAEEAMQQSKTERIINSLKSGDEFISNVFVFANYGQPFSTISVNKELEKGFYDKFNQSGDAAGIVETTESQIWQGSHPFLDSQFPDNKTNYSLTYIKEMVNSMFRPIGYIIMDIDNAFIMNILKKTDFGSSSIVGFVTNDGKAMLSGDDSEGFDITAEAFYQKAMAGSEKLSSDYVELNNEDYFFIYSKLTIGNVTVFALIPRTEVVRQADEAGLLTIIIVILSSPIALAVGLVISSGIEKVIHRMNKTLYSVSTGDLTVAVNIRRKDEFSILGKSINHMISGMKSLIEKMLGVSKSTAASANDVSGVSETILISSKKIAGAVSDIEHGVSQQAADAENCLLRMADLAKQINMVHESTGEISYIADAAKNTVKNGLGVINDLSGKSKDTANITQLVIRNIETLKEESEAIISIIGAMDEITKQTNLLALNATIEAVRAGAAGRGFGVIADEIRKLSNKSSKESRRISEIIEEIQSRTKKTADAARMAEDIVAAQGIALQDTMKTFSGINQHVEDLTNNLSNISLGIEKISNAKNDTLTAIESISASLEETVAASAEVSSTAEKQLSSVEQLNRAAFQLESEAKNLEETVRIFKTS